MSRWDWAALERAGGLKAPPVKPEKPCGPGVEAKRRKTKAGRRERIEKRIREEVLALDGYRCRYPDCDIPIESLDGRLECAHFVAAGMGGDPELVRYTPTNLIALCYTHHQSRIGLHWGDLKMQPMDETRGTRGLVEFFRREPGEADRWYSIGVTEPPRRHAA